MISPWSAVQIVDTAIEYVSKRRFVYPTARGAMLKACIASSKFGPEQQMDALETVLRQHSRTWDNDDPCDEVRV